MFYKVFIFLLLQNIFKVCMDNGSRIDETDNKYNNSAVHMASVLGSMELLKLFKEKQPDLLNQMVII